MRPDKRLPLRSVGSNLQYPWRSKLFSKLSNVHIEVAERLNAALLSIFIKHDSISVSDGWRDGSDHRKVVLVWSHLFKCGRYFVPEMI